jgi:hypothetical protein
MSDSKGLGRFFKGDESGNSGSAGVRDFAEADRTISALQSRIAELEGAVGRPSFIDMDEDALTQIAAEDAAVIIRAARLRAGKLIEQATDTLQQAESEREQIRASCELDARQTREAANVDARKLRAEATATLETARDQAAQLLEATQNDADSQASENQKVIAKLLEDATRRANEVINEAESLKTKIDKEIETQRAAIEAETSALRANTEAELNTLRSETEKTTSAQLLSAQTEAKRLQTEATNASQSMIEKASADARALAEAASNNHASALSDAQAKLQQAEVKAEQILSQAQTKADEVLRQALAKSQTEATTLRDAAAAYRNNVIGSLDANNEIFIDLKNRITELRKLWFDSAQQHLKESEDSVEELLNRFASGRIMISNTFAELPLELKEEQKAEDS